MSKAARGTDVQDPQLRLQHHPALCEGVIYEWFVNLKSNVAQLVPSFPVHLVPQFFSISASLDILVQYVEATLCV